LVTLGGEVRMQELRELVSEIPDFPQPGILFRDISPLLRQRFGATIAAVDDLFTGAEWAGVDAVAGIESRGFILASALAERRGKGFVPIRKKGKLPPPVVDVAYDLEYGAGVLEMQTGRGRLLLVDDVLATGGTLGASAALSRQAGYTLCGLAVLVDLGMAPGFRAGDLEARSVLRYG
jgi:adenine phosphoribosyltransferase